MEGSSFDSNSNQSSPSAANEFLSNLPSRGLFSSSLISSNPGGMRVYVCDHDTCPPEDQCIKTDQQNILIRSLTLNKYKGDSKGGVESSRKRAGEKIQDTRGKRLNSQANSGQEGSNGQTSTKEKDLQSLTVERLRALLKAKGLPPKGKKDELIARLRNANG